MNIISLHLDKMQFISCNIVSFRLNVLVQQDLQYISSEFLRVKAIPFQRLIKITLKSDLQILFPPSIRTWSVVTGTWILWLSISWECHHPIWRTHIFQRGRSTTNQDHIYPGGFPSMLRWYPRGCPQKSTAHWFSWNTNGTKNFIIPTDELIFFIYIYIHTGWWFGTWILFFHIFNIHEIPNS